VWRFPSCCSGRAGAPAAQVAGPGRTEIADGPSLRALAGCPRAGFSRRSAGIGDHGAGRRRQPAALPPSASADPSDPSVRPAERGDPCAETAPPGAAERG
jgi:hypothetical protein